MCVCGVYRAHATSGPMCGRRFVLRARAEECRALLRMFMRCVCRVCACSIGVRVLTPDCFGFSMLGCVSRLVIDNTYGSNKFVILATTTSALPPLSLSLSLAHNVRVCVYFDLAIAETVCVCA